MISSTEPGYRYCLRCGLANEAREAICRRCQVPLAPSHAQAVAGTAFLMNEVQGPLAGAIVSGHQREQLLHLYESELVGLTGQSVHETPAWAAAETGRRAVPAPAVTARAPAQPRQPRPPRDWSWLTEQQANLFLFAGAFLVVIAALVYVGYSGEAMSGGLKMALLVAYTLAFLAAGAACLRVPRVEVAGHVFLAVGAILVPLGFVAAQTMIAGENVRPESMWLAGSLATAIFYAALALLGLGALYAFGSGLALVSATTAIAVLVRMRPEWAPVLYLGPAILMAAAEIVGPAVVRQRLGRAWALEAHAVALLSVMVAVVVALAAAGSDGHFHLSSRSFLPLTFALATVYTAAQVAAFRRQEAGVALLATFSATFLACVYAANVPGEYYVVALAALAPVLGLAIVAIERGGWEKRLPEGAVAAIERTAVGWTAAAVLVGAILAASAANTANPDHFDLHTRWFLLIAVGLVFCFYALEAAVRRQRIGAPGMALALTGAACAVVYGLSAGAEYYAFSVLAPVLLVGVVVGLGEEALRRRFHADSPGDLTALAWAGTVTGVGVAIGAAIIGAQPDATYRPDSGVFLPLAFLLAAVYLALDASAEKRWETSAALLAALSGAGISVVYAAGAGPQWYGVAFVAAGLLLGFGGRIWSPAWLDERPREAMAFAWVSAAWLPFQGIYGNGLPRFGAGVHLAAAIFYAAAALPAGETVLDRALKGVLGSPVRSAVAWLYAAGATLALGYVYLLRSLPAAEGAEAGSLALPMLGMALAFLVAGASARWWRPAFQSHVYLMGLLLAVVSLSLAPDAATLSAILTTLVVAFAAVAAWEDEPLAGVPALAFGFGAVAAWRQYLDLPLAFIPVVYSIVGAVLYAAGVPLRDRLPTWSAALRSAGALYALSAPAAGFGILAANSEDGLFRGAGFEQSALYQWSTAASAVAGVLATVEALVSRRRWLAIPGSAVITIALLLEIGHFRPENVQAYTSVVGAYLVLLAIAGLWKLHLAPAMEPSAWMFEALGAAVVMFPSFAQSLDGGWRYQLILLWEAVAFLAVGAGLRRHGLVTAALGFLVLVAGRALFDAVNALPNWVVILVAGMGLLAAGFAILLGRDRWEHWQRALLSWWDEGGESRPMQR